MKRVVKCAMNKNTLAFWMELKLDELGNCNVIGYSNSDYVGDIENKISIAGFIEVLVDSEFAIPPNSSKLFCHHPLQALFLFGCIYQDSIHLSKKEFFGVLEFDIGKTLRNKIRNAKAKTLKE